MAYLSEDPSDGLTQYAPQQPAGAYTNPGGTVQVSSAPGMGFAATGVTTSTAYVPGAVYAPPAGVGVSMTPTAGYVPVAGETLYVSRSKSVISNTPMLDDVTPNPKADAVPSNIQITLGLGTIEETRAQIFNMSEDELRELQKKFGVKPTGFADPATVDAVDGFLSYVSDINASGVQKTWQQVLNQLTDGGKTSLMDALSGGSEEPFSGSKTTTSYSSKVFSPTEVRGMSDDIFQSALGKRPTQEQLADIRAAVNRRSEHNPVDTTTTQTYKDGELVSTHSVTGGAPNFDQQIENIANRQEGAAEYRALNYFDAMMSMLAAPGGS